MDLPSENHKPVLLKETFDILDPKPKEFFVDGTLGLAGHAREALVRISPGGIFLGMDRDEESAGRAKDILVNYRDEKKLDAEIIVAAGNFTEVPEIISGMMISRKPDCLLLDLGFSSAQVFSGKGFSYDRDEPLIMRYDGDVRALTAARVVNEYDKKKLSEILKDYGEERFSDRIAGGIVKKRKEKPIRTTGELAVAVKDSLPAKYPFKIRPEARTFLALRNFVNDEIGDLKRIMGLIPEIMAEGGRVAVITFNSLEDRIVKESFRELGRKGAVLLTKKPISPSMGELKENNRARSAKLRVIKI